MSHTWKVWVTVCVFDQEAHTSVHLTEKRAVISSIKEMLETLDDTTDDVFNEGEESKLESLELERLNNIWTIMAEKCSNGEVHYDIHENTVQA